ncbi:hypothetical protein AVEN_166267-1 [Araneus ventricosus]|uniref:Uncharacterized protein n=1 Tax=Araneus ventricosus TaxID=182803 RepID=A0A4Y2IRY3_ARAVE|nr:hypothetical protein AVEN_166267-1 [Araneus ventricosus]
MLQPNLLAPQCWKSLDLGARGVHAGGVAPPNICRTNRHRTHYICLGETSFHWYGVKVMAQMMLSSHNHGFKLRGAFQNSTLLAQNWILITKKEERQASATDHASFKFSQIFRLTLFYTVRLQILH